MEYSITISGSGTNEQLAKALKSLADQIEAGEHEESVEKRGECDWEDSVLYTEIEEADEED